MGLGRQVVVTHGNLPQLVAKRDEIEADNLCRKIGASPVLRYRPDLGSVLEQFQLEIDRRECSGAITSGTLRTYGNHISAFQRWSEETGMDRYAAEDLRRTHVEQYCAWRGTHTTRVGTSKVRGSSMRTELSTLRQALRHAEITVNWRAPHFLSKARGKRILSAAEFFSWLECMPVGSLERTAAELAWRTAARPSDWIRFRWSNVDRERGLLKFDVQKLRGQRHSVPLTDEILHHLNAWRTSSERGNILRGLWSLHADRQAMLRDTIFITGTTARPRRLRTNSLRRRWVQASKSAGIDPPIKAAGVLRNQFIALALASGSSAYAVARHVGHSSLNLLIRYAEQDLPTELIQEMTGKIDERRRVIVQER